MAVLPRASTLLGCPLTVDEVAYVTEVIRRIAALVLLAAELDQNYAAVKTATYAWPAERFASGDE